MGPVVVNDLNFQQEVLGEKGKPVLVDFWAVWCYPCKAQAPIVEELARQMDGRIKVAKVEVDDSPNTAAQYNVLSIPTLAIFKDGQMVWQGVGVHQKGVLAAELSKHL